MALCGALLGAPRVAAAQPTEAVEGNIILIEERDIIVDIAGARGALSGDEIEVWRPMVLRHPVTNREVKDRFRIGSLRLDQVRDALSTAHPDGALDRPPQVGDVVVLRRVKPKPPDTPPPPEPRAPGPTPGPGAPPGPTPGPKPGPTPGPEPTVAPAPSAPAKPTPEQQDGLELAALFESLSGHPLAERVARYGRWQREHPTSRYHAVVREQLEHLRRLAAVDTATATSRAPRVVAFAPPAEVAARRALGLEMELGGEPSAVWLHLRHASEGPFRTVALARTEGDYWGVTLSAEDVGSERLELFVEAAGAPGEATVALVATAQKPLSVPVVAPPDLAELAPSVTTVALWTDYADYNRLRGNDFVWQSEGCFSLRYDDTGFRALRSGFGVYRGIGGSIEELDELGLEGRSIGLTYGYLELEVGFHELFGASARAILGLRDAGVGGGGQLALRIGRDLGTNLVLGGELLGGVGLRGTVALEMNEIPDVPMLFAAEVTNQPAGVRGEASGDASEVAPSLDTNNVGGRAIIQAGYRFVDAFVVSARLSYQGRTIYHSGPGFGGGVSYTW
ncbi:MAG: hypothetical protein HY908_30840 [Myxococcales bacterium]|nr:hypothetical protein [Myxococcales bacterium]